MFPITPTYYDLPAARMILCNVEGRTINQVGHGEFIRLFDYLYKEWRPYTQTIALWQTYFNDVHVGFYDDLNEDPAMFFGNICAFLGIDETAATRNPNQRVHVGLQEPLPLEFRQYLYNQYAPEMNAMAESGIEYAHTWLDEHCAIVNRETANTWREEMQQQNGQPPKQRAVMLTPEFVNNLNAGKEPQFRLPNKVLVGTHHKTGSTWMLSILVQSALAFGLKLFFGEQDQLPRDAQLFFHENSQFDLSALSGPYRGLHLIRDPRDITVSACFFHQKSAESWLHVPQHEFGGLTYQEKINSYDNLADQLLFEMEHSSRWIIEHMLGWNYQNPAFIEVKYEQLIIDSDLLLFREIFTFLGFPPRIVLRMLPIAYRHSLFSGKVENQTHVRSGKARQWPEYFTADYKARFLSLYGDALIKLGYEEDDEWAISP